MVVGGLILSSALFLDTHHALILMMELLALIGSNLRVLCHGSLDEKLLGTGILNTILSLLDV